MHIHMYVYLRWRRSRPPRPSGLRPPCSSGLEVLELDRENFLARYVCPRVGWPGHLFLIGNAVRLSKRFAPVGLPEADYYYYTVISNNYTTITTITTIVTMFLAKRCAWGAHTGSGRNYRSSNSSNII